MALWWLVPLPALAQVPPPDFRGTLFIDAAGCVRERAGPDWLPRLLPDGGPDCGYPPTPLPEAPPRTSDLPLPPGVPEAEARLLVTMAEGLRPGDFLPPVPVPDPPKLRHPALDSIQLAMSAEGMAARAVVADNRPNARLCALLGQQGGADAVPGSDPSRGFCPGAAPQPIAAALRPAARLVERGEAAADRIDRPSPAGASGSMPPAAPPGLAPPARPLRVRPAAAADLRGGAAPVRPAGVAPARKAAALDAAMIPAGARYLQLGLQADPVAARSLFDRIAALGLPVAQGRVAGGAGILVMAGPFEGREAIVRAHDRLRAAGFDGIVPR